MSALGKTTATEGARDASAPVSGGARDGIAGGLVASLVAYLVSTGLDPELAAAVGAMAMALFTGVRKYVLNKLTSG